MATGPGATAASATDRAAPRICIVVIMNHPFPEQIPLLRRIYADRFSALRVLIPFERLPDEDVVTVYRGSYTHSGYITDARRELAAVDCDYYIVLHDDVLLNPQLDEASFLSVFPLGPDDGFIPAIAPVQHEPGDWSWYFGMLPKLLHPKSHLFGAGIERENLAKYLPPADRLLEKLRAGALHHTVAAGLGGEATGDIARIPTRTLLQGLGGELRQDDPGQAALDARCLALERELTHILYDYEAMYRPDRTHPEAKAIDLPLPIVTSGFCTDFYIVPKSGFDTFAHYVGVSSAANLFVEIMTPMVLVEACARVRVAQELGIDWSGFTMWHDFGWFADPRAFALHPFKLSRVADPAYADAFIDQLQAIRSGAIDAAAARYLGTPHALIHPGWHPPEPWGMWACAQAVVVPLAMAAAGRVTLSLLAPVAPPAPAMTLVVEHAGGPPQTIAFDLARNSADVRLEHVVPDADGIARIRLTTDHMICPMHLDPNTRDARHIGIGLVRVAQGQ